MAPTTTIARPPVGPPALGTPPRTRRSSAIFIVALVSIVLISGFLFSSRAANLNKFTRSELYYAEISREMLADGELVTPIMNGVFFCEKPALVYWPIMASYKLFDVSRWSARLPSILAALLCVALTCLFVRHQFGWRAGLLCAVCLVTTTRFLDFASMAMSDMMLTLFDFTSLAFLYYGLQSVHKRTLFFWLASVSMSIAVLIKGPIGFVLPCLAFGLYLLLTKSWRVVNLKHCVIMFGTVALIAGSFFFEFARRNGWETVNAFLLRDNLGIFFGTYRAAPVPRFLFLSDLIMGFVPWSFVLPVVLWNTWKKLRAKSQIGNFRCELFLASWVVLVTVFLSLSRSRMTYYDLPCFPQAAALMGIYLSQWFEKPTKPLIFQTWFLVAGLMVASVVGLFAGQTIGIDHFSTTLSMFVIGAVAACSAVMALESKYVQSFVLSLIGVAGVYCFYSTEFLKAEAAYNPLEGFGKIISHGPKTAKIGIGVGLSRTLKSDGVSRVTFDTKRVPVELYSVQDVSNFVQLHEPIYLVVSESFYKTLPRDVMSRLKVLEIKPFMPPRWNLLSRKKCDSLVLMTNSHHALMLDDCFKNSSSTNLAFYQPQ